jgi:hypothetical protein
VWLMASRKAQYRRMANISVTGMLWFIGKTRH